MLWGVVFALALLGFCLALSVIDLRSFRLPNVLTFPLIALGLIQAAILQDSLMPYVIGAAVGYGVFVGIETAYKRLRGVDGLGRGDAKLLAGAGAWVGWFWLPHIVLISSVSAIGWILIARLRGQAVSKDRAIAFGPFLCLGLVTLWLWVNGPKIWP